MLPSEFANDLVSSFFVIPKQCFQSNFTIIPSSTSVLTNATVLVESPRTRLLGCMLVGVTASTLTSNAVCSKPRPFSNVCCQDGVYVAYSDKIDLIDVVNTTTPVQAPGTTKISAQRTLLAHRQARSS